MSAKRFLALMGSVAILVPVVVAQDITFSQTDKAIQYPARFVAQGDINRDGYPDFLFGLTGSLNIYTLKSNGSGGYVNWTIPTSYCPSSPLGFGDFQRNGKNDLLVSTSTIPTCAHAASGTFGDYLNNGSGTFQLYKKFPTVSFAAQAAVVADFNHDMKVDLVVADGKQLELYYGQGNGGFAGPYKITSFVGTPASLTASFYNLIAGDFDGNGCTDVAWTEYEAYGQRGFKSQLRVAYGNCSGGFSVVTPYNVIGEIDNIQATDLNRDGVSDIVATLDAAGEGVTNPTLQISYGHKNRTFTTKLISDPSLSGPIQVADLNGDGFPDIAYVSSSASGAEIKIVEGDAAQSFSRISVHPLSAANSLPTQILSGDYNRDGKTDLAVLATKLPANGGGEDLALLANTSPYPHGVCVPPVTPGIRVCSPGTTSGTTINVLAAATNPNPTIYMELWVDGVKRFAYGSTHELRGTLTLAPGSHRFTYFSSDAAGIRNQLVTYVTVK